MIARFALFVIRFYSILPTRIYNWALDVLDCQAWRDGYECACTDLSLGNASHLTCLERISPEFRKHPKPPAVPRLLTTTGDTTYAWDRGYERAILLSRCDINPAALLRTKNFLSQSPECGIIDTAIIAALSGLVRPDPRRRELPTGTLQVLATNADHDIAVAYRHYCETIQQITGNLDYEIITRQSKRA